MDWQASDFNNSWRFASPIPRPTFGNVDRYYQLLLERSGFRRYGREGGP
jgi:hypothetical protein